MTGAPERGALARGHTCVLALRLLGDLPPTSRPVEIHPRVVLIRSGIGRWRRATRRRRDWSVLADYQLDSVVGLHRQRSPHNGGGQDLNPGAVHRIAPSTHSRQALDVTGA